MLVDLNIPPEKISIRTLGEFGFYHQGSPELAGRDPNTILFFGALRPNKGVGLLIPIADAVHKQVNTAHFIVAGPSNVDRDLMRSEWPRELAQTLSDMRARSYFEVHEGFIEDREVARLFARAAIALLPYTDATQSATTMVAMPFGCAIVATDVGDIREQVGPANAGILCQVDPTEIAHEIVDLLKHPERAVEMGQSGKRFSETTASWDSIASSMLPIYESVCTRRASNHRREEPTSPPRDTQPTKKQPA